MAVGASFGLLDRAFGCPALFLDEGRKKLTSATITVCRFACFVVGFASVLALAITH